MVKKVRVFNEELLEGEIFKPFPSNPQYLVSTRGRVYSMKTSRFLRPSKNRGGYLWINLSCPESYGRAFRIHRLVALVFLGSPPNDKQDVNHIDGNKTNNNVENLEWSNKSLNGKHAYKLKLRGVVSLRGDKHPMRVIDSVIAKQVKTLLLLGMSKIQISKKLGISKNIVYNISGGKTWKHVLLDNITEKEE